MSKPYIITINAIVVVTDAAEHDRDVLRDFHRTIDNLIQETFPKASFDFDMKALGI